MSGRRELKTDEKSFVAEIARSFHVEKAINKGAKIEKKNTTATNGELATKKKRARKSGGSIWIIFKGGFSGVPTHNNNSNTTKDDEAKTSRRGETSERCFIKAVATAEAYMESAREQAAAAGLHYTGESAAHAKTASRVAPSETIDYSEGDAYLKEQRTIAVTGINKILKAPCGAHLRSLLVGNSSSSPQANTSSTDILPPSFATREARESFEDALVAAKRLLGGDSNSVLPLVDSDSVRAPFYFTLSQQQDSQIPGENSNGNTVCIVRSKVSPLSNLSDANDEKTQTANKKTNTEQKARKKKEERGKKNTVIFRTKAKAEAFVQSFMNNVIRKEMSGAMRVRDGTGYEPATTTSSVVDTIKDTAKGAGKGKKGRR